MSSILQFYNLYNKSKNDSKIYVNENYNTQGFHKGWIFYYHSILMSKFFTLLVIYNTFLLLTGYIELITSLYYLVKIVLFSYLLSISNTIYHHRLVSHKSWECNRIVQIFLNILGSIPIYRRIKICFYASSSS